MAKVKVTHIIGGEAHTLDCGPLRDLCIWLYLDNLVLVIRVAGTYLVAVLAKGHISGIGLIFSCAYELL